MLVFGKSSEVTICSKASGVKMINHLSFNKQFRINQKGEKRLRRAQSPPLM